MTNERVSSVLLCAVAISAAVALPGRAELIETWESQAAENPFTGTGDLSWTGDLSAWAITTATWPASPAQDFAGSRSLRSANHGSTSDGTTVVETVVTDITSEVDFGRPMEWSVFFSGNSITIQPSRRADFILLADTSDVGVIEDPSLLNGYKLTLTDPYANASDNVPPFSHEDTVGLADSVTLWSVADDDDRWRVVGSIPVGSTENIRDGWNLRVRRDPDGTWSVGFANGAIGQTPPLTSLGIDADGPDLSAFSGSVYAGVGWTAPNNSTADHTDFGFDNFRVATVPEPATLALVLLGLLALIGLANRP